MTDRQWTRGAKKEGRHENDGLLVTLKPEAARQRQLTKKEKKGSQ